MTLVYAEQEQRASSETSYTHGKSCHAVAASLTEGVVRHTRATAVAVLGMFLIATFKRKGGHIPLSYVITRTGKLWSLQSLLESHLVVQ